MSYLDEEVDIVIKEREFLASLDSQHLELLQFMFENIPNFDGVNLVREFVSKCKIAQSLIGTPEIDQVLIKWMKEKLFGDAWRLMGGLRFYKVEDFLTFIEKKFYKDETFFEELDRLRKTRQAPQESVIEFSNRIKDIGGKIVDAAFEEGRVTRSHMIKDEMTECFMRGLSDEIYMPQSLIPKDLDEAVYVALLCNQRANTESTNREELTLVNEETQVTKMGSKTNRSRMNAQINLDEIHPDALEYFKIIRLNVPFYVRKNSDVHDFEKILGWCKKRYSDVTLKLTHQLSGENKTLLRSIKYRVMSCEHIFRDEIFARIIGQLRAAEMNPIPFMKWITDKKFDQSNLLTWLKNIGEVRMIIFRRTIITNASSGKSKIQTQFKFASQKFQDLQKKGNV